MSWIGCRNILAFIHRSSARSLKKRLCELQVFADFVSYSNPTENMPTDSL